MNPADKTAGFSALRAVAPLIHAMSKGAKGEKLIGMAVCHLIYQETRINIGAGDRTIGGATCDEMRDIAAALRTIFGLPKTENRSENSEISASEISESGPIFGSENSEISDSEKPFSPRTPLSEEEKKKRNISSSSSSSYGEASKGEWDEYAREIGIFGSEISEKAWRNYCENGPKTVKYWRRYLSAYKANAEKSAAKSSEKFAHLARAFGTKTEAAK